MKVQSGSSVPADLRLLQSAELESDESLLTGESVPVTKDAGAELAEDIPLGDRSTLLHAGTSVVRGRGLGVVVRTAAATDSSRHWSSACGVSPG